MENSITKLKNDKSSFPSVLEKYSRLQNEKARPENAYKDVKLSVNLLDRFVQGESLNQVVITLYPGNEGYTLALKIHNTLENETARIPYEEDELLNCIESQQLPPVLVELLEEAGADVFYDGCVFVEVKDLRGGSKQSWNVLLKPSPQTILADAQQICHEQGWGSEELIQLESILCMAMAEPLCLNPNPSVGELAMNRDSTAKQLHSTALRRTRRRWSEGRKRKQTETSQSPNNDFKLHDFLKKKSLLGRGIPPILQQPQEDRNGLPSSSTSSVQLDVSDVLRLAKPLERPKETGDCSMIPCEEYLYETDRVNGRVYLVRLTILQRPAIEEFLGQLYVDRDFRDGKLTGGASCMFTLGSRIHVNRYIQQFTEIFTEEGRKSVKITHQVQGHPPRVMYTHSMREKERLREKEEKQQQLIQQQLQQQPSVAQQLPVNKDATETQPTNATQPIPIKTENHQTSGTITKTALLESLKSGQVSPAIASLVTNLLSSNQQQQPQPIRPSATAVGLNANVVMANGHHHQLQQQQQQQQQSLLRTPAVVRPSTTMTVASGPAGSGQNVQLVTQSISLQQAQQPQLRPNSNVRPTALAALLTNSKVTTLPPNISPGKGKFVAIDAGANGSAGVAGGGGGNTILMGQVVRPVVSGVAAPVLPSYSQAIGQTTAGATIVRTIRPAVHPSTTGVVKRTTETVAVNGSGGTQRFSLTVPALSALLAGTPSADSPGANNVTTSQNLPSLLERLQQQSSPSKPIVHALNNNHHQMHTIKPGLNMSNNNLNVQSINLTGVQGAVANLPTLQSIQVSIPGLAVPLSLSLAVSSNSGTAGSTTITTSGTMGNVRLTTAGSLGGTGQPISIPLSVLQQVLTRSIPNASGATGVQLMGNVATKDGTQAQPLKVAVTTGAGVAQLSSGGQSSGSLLAQQQVLQMALQRQMQMTVQQKMAAKQKSKPPHS
ncbi:transcription factor SPT20 homolog isoform X1 [Daphnia pulicaria]|uniref:transcription factor SPT20 homolog isoform X1 n=1 Tax=Daphnia pulicaria TaxID=35523 RepID=UPI001EEC7BFF|nr:transcription factor SPT20 homolog isoform X1 [Daphnia pulicaria]